MSVKHARGFTLIELVMVIVIMGVISTMVAVFMRSPITAYFDSARRAALTDTADTAVRRMSRDIQRSLPNSIRVANSGACIEFIPVKAGGRYRAEGANALALTSTGGKTFNMLGSSSTWPPDQQIAIGDTLVFYNLGPPQTGDLDAYQGTNTAAVTGVTPASPEDSIQISVATPFMTTFPFAQTTNRFQVVSGTERMVSYVCLAGTLRRTVSSAFTVAPSCPTSGPAIANNVDCANTALTYDPNQMRNAFVTMVLRINDSSGTESVTLQHSVHVDNTP